MSRFPLLLALLSLCNAPSHAQGCSQFATCATCVSSTPVTCYWSQPPAATVQAGACVNDTAPFAGQPATYVAYQYCPPGQYACDALDSPSCTTNQYCDWNYRAASTGDAQCQDGFCALYLQVSTTSVYRRASATGLTCVASYRGLSAAAIGVIIAAALLLLLTLLSMFVCRAFCVDVILFSCMPAWLYRYTGGCKRKNLTTGEPMRAVHHVGA